jgi:copper transport protein
VVAVLLAAAALLLSAGPAAAHAYLLSVDPPDRAVLAESPDEIRLTFSEPVSADLGGVQVLDAEGGRVEDGVARVEGAVVTVGVQPDLPDGTYVVSFRVVSADGHPVRGGSVFGVGDVELDAGALGRVTDESGDQVWEVVGGVFRGLAYAGVLVAAGGGAFLVHAHRGGPERPRLVRLVRVAAAVGWVTALVAVPVQAALGTGQGPGSLFDDGVLGDVLADGLGHSLLLLTTGLLLVVLGLGRSVPATLLGAAVAAGSFAASGHNRAGDDATLATLADIAHLVAAAAWAGGLVLLWRTVRLRRQEDVVETGHVVRRFSQLATGGILLVGAAGVALSWKEVGSLDALTGTSYGLFLLAKVALVGGIAALGAYNHFRLVPALEQGKAKAALRRLRSTLVLELGVLVLVVALTSVLVVLTPAKADQGGGVVEQIVELGDGYGSVQVVVDPARVGFNELHLYTYDADGRPAEVGEEVVLELSLPSSGLGPIERTPLVAGPAHLQLDGTDFAVPGEWQLLIRVRVDRFTEVAGTTSVPIAP